MPHSCPNPKSLSFSHKINLNNSIISLLFRISWMDNPVQIWNSNRCQSNNTVKILFKNLLGRLRRLSCILTVISAKLKLSRHLLSPPNPSWPSSPLLSCSSLNSNNSHFTNLLSSSKDNCKMIVFITSITMGRRLRRVFSSI